MRFRIGVVVGAASGYVLGARAGRQRYEQIRRGYRSVKASTAYEALVTQAIGVGDLARGLVATGLDLSSRKIRHQAELRDGTRELLPGASRTGH